MTDLFTGRDMVRAFTQRDTTEAMPKEELLERLDIILSTFFAEKASPVEAANALRGALIRLGQAYGDTDVTEKLNQLVDHTIAITGL